MGPPQWWACLRPAAMIAGINLVSRRTKLPEDTGIGLLFVGMLALGVVIISASGAFQGDLLAILFGQILGLPDGHDPGLLSVRVYNANLRC